MLSGDDDKVFIIYEELAGGRGEGMLLILIAGLLQGVRR